MSILNVTLLADTALVATDTQLSEVPWGSQAEALPRVTSAEEAYRLAFTDEPGTPARAIGHRQKFLALPKQRVVVAGSGAMRPLWELREKLENGPLGLDELAPALPAMLAEIVTRHPLERNMLVVALGWSEAHGRCAGYTYATADGFAPAELPVGANLAMPPLWPQDPAYGACYELYRQAGAGRKIEAYHRAAADNQVRTSAAGRHAGLSGIGGELWLCVVTRKGAWARNLGAL